MFYTADNRIGICDSFAQPGDVCCISPGCPLPHILHEQPDGRYNTIGCCYIDGIMRGELMGLPEVLSKKETIILV